MDASPRSMIHTGSTHVSAIDVERLLHPISDDSPCGDDLEYDAAFLAMQREAAGKPEQVMGGQTVPGEEPEWRSVAESAEELLGRSKDIRIAVLLARALLNTKGMGGFADGLALVQGLIERYWEPVHPRLDPDDDNDPIMRVNAIAALSDRELTVNAIRLMPLASSRRLGRYNLRDVEIANGTLPRPEGAEGLDQGTIDAAFLDMDGDELTALSENVTAAVTNLVRLESALDSAVGSAAGADLTLLKSTLRSIRHQLDQQLQRRGLGGEAGAAAEAGGESYASGGGAPAMSGSIQGREDIIRTLDRICGWYETNEPASPVPLLLQRAKRLVSKDFLELVRDLSPSGLSELQNIAGIENE
jgi:type VI secretion system protein ImpA